MYSSSLYFRRCSNVSSFVVVRGSSVAHEKGLLVLVLLVLERVCGTSVLLVPLLGLVTPTVAVVSVCPVLVVVVLSLLPLPLLPPLLLRLLLRPVGLVRRTTGYQP